MPDTGIISTTESGVDLVVHWKIEKIFNLPQWDGALYWSPTFSFGSERWRLRIFPTGSSGRDSSGHVDLRLVKCISHRSIKQTFSLSLKTAKGDKYNEQHLTKVFDDDNHSHTFNRFIPRSELSRRKSDLALDGTLTVICTMKSSTSDGIDNNVASASAKCCHCKGTFNADGLSSHQQKCMHRPIKCPDCLEVVVLQTWLEEHECQQKRPEGNSGSAEHRTSDSDSAESSSDSGSGECCHKCSNCLDIVKKQKKLLEELESQKKRSEGAGSLCEDYKKVLLEGRHHDLILKVGDKELRAHRDILRARSKIFESMLDHDMKEKNTGIIDVPDCDPNAMELFLSYVYCGKIAALDHSNMLGLYYVADKYEMMELKRECCNFIKKSLSLTNICSVIQLALHHSDSDLLEYATGYFSDNMLDILQTVEWQSFLKDNCTIGNELLIKSVKLKNAQA